MEKRSSQGIVPFQEIISALLDNNHPFPPVLLHRFSDMEDESLQKLKAIWLQINPERRVNLLEDLEDISAADTLVCFDGISRLALDDPEAPARSSAIRLLDECDNNHLVPIFMRMMEKDKDEKVRAIAASALGKYVYLGELEEIPEDVQKKVEDSLIRTIKGTDTPLVRQQSLESLGFSSREDVPPLIQAAYTNQDVFWVASALVAMGHSADERWLKQVIESLKNSEPLIQIEAIRAAGELQLDASRSILLKLLKKSSSMDFPMRSAIIWSLSEIGGDGVLEALAEAQDEADEEDEIEFIESAVDNLEFNSGFTPLNIMDIGAPNEDDLDIEDVPTEEDEGEGGEGDEDDDSWGSTDEDDDEQ